jgi:hypothetical protein
MTTLKIEKPVKISNREQAMILAALRLWQNTYVGGEAFAALEDIATDAGSFEQLDYEGIDKLCRKLNP